MQITSKFTAAVHILTCIEVFGGEMRVTSDFLSGSTGVNAVIVRNVLGQLREAGIVETRHTGTWKTTYDIIFEDIYDHSSKKDYAHIEDFDTIKLNKKEFYIFQNENSTDANLIYNFDEDSYLLIRVIGREKALYNNVGNKIEEDEALVDSTILNNSKILKVLDFEIIK